MISGFGELVKLEHVTYGRHLWRYCCSSFGLVVKLGNLQELQGERGSKAGSEREVGTGTNNCHVL